MTRGILHALLTSLMCLCWSKAFLQVQTESLHDQVTGFAFVQEHNLVTRIDGLTTGSNILCSMFAAI